MGAKSNIYKMLRIWNDVDAVKQAGKHRSTQPIFNRIGRRAAGKITGKAIGSIFRNRY